MATKIEIYSDKECKTLLSDLGELEVDENNKINFYVKNIGSTYLWQPEVSFEFPGVTKVTASIPQQLKPGQSFKGSVEVNPKEQDEGIKKGKIYLNAKSVGTESIT